MQRLKRLFLIMFSIGWVFPLWMASWLFIDFWQTEGWHLLMGKGTPNSFDWFGSIKECLHIGFAWLAISAAYWVWRATRRDSI